jgi:hypothetical protein
MRYEYSSIWRECIDNGNTHEVSEHTVDISWVDWAYKSSTCDVMYCIMGVQFRNTICHHRSSPFIGGLRCQAIQTDHCPYIAERTQLSILWDVYVSEAFLFGMLLQMYTVQYTPCKSFHWNYYVKKAFLLPPNPRTS